MTESQLQSKILKYLNGLDGALFVKFAAGKYSKAGVSDILGCYRSKFYALEVKLPGKHPTKLQSHFIKKIRETGGVAVVVCSLGQVKKIFEGRNEISL